MKPDRLYFVTRTDLTEGRRAAQVIHAMDAWCNNFGPHGGTVIVYEVPTEQDLLLVWDHVKYHRGVIFLEPDLGDQPTAFATEHGPMDLPLLGSLRSTRPDVHGTV